METEYIWWYGVCTIISGLIQYYCNGWETKYASYLLGSGDVASTLLLALLIWSVSEGVKLTLELFTAIIRIELKNLKN